MGKCILNLWYLRAVLSLKFETKNGKLERSADSTRWKQGCVLTNGQIEGADRNGGPPNLELPMLIKKSVYKRQGYAACDFKKNCEDKIFLMIYFI